MRFNNRHFMPIFVFLIISFLPGLGWCEKSSDISNSSFETVTARLISCLQADDIDCAVKMFHFPASYNQEELNEDIVGIKSSLQIFRNEFGSIRQVSLNKSPVQYYKVSVESANLPYWQRHPYSIETKYKVIFDKVGEGYISVQACKINSYWEIRNIGYALSVDLPDSKNIITDVAKKVLLLMEKQNNAREKGLRDKGRAPKTF